MAKHRGGAIMQVLNDQSLPTKVCVKQVHRQQGGWPEGECRGSNISRELVLLPEKQTKCHCWYHNNSDFTAVDPVQLVAPHRIQQQPQNKRVVHSDCACNLQQDSDTSDLSKLF